MNATVENFVHSIKFADEFMEKIKERIVFKWQDWERQTATEKINLNDKEKEIEYKITQIIETIKKLSSTTAIQLMEVDLEKLEREKADLVVLRDKKEDEQFDIQVLINYAKYFLEHLGELLLEGSDPRNKASLFALLFEEPPTYDELSFGTPKLRPLFKLNKEYLTNKGVLSEPNYEQFELLMQEYTKIYVKLKPYVNQKVNQKAFQGRA